MSSPSVRPTRSAYAIGLDVGGTKIAGGVVQEDGEIIGRASVATPTDEDGSSTLTSIVQLVELLRRQYPEVQAIGVGAAGMIDWPAGHIRWAPNNSYRNLALKDLLTKASGLPTIVDNDANVAAWAEVRAGAGISCRNLAVLTVGTGIGAGLILDGRLYRGATGIGGEVGHMIVNPAGARCGCGSTGCLEAMASGSALGRLGRAAAHRHPESMLATRANSPEEVTGEVVFEAARAGDRMALSLFDEIGYWLGIGIASLVNLLDVEQVVIGGGLSATGELLLVPTRASFSNFVFSRSHRRETPIILARLGREAGIVGSGMLALEISRAAMGAGPALSAGSIV